MKKILGLLLFLVLAYPAWAAQYYLSPTGNDAHAGTSTGTAWLTPNHAVNCGDVITAAVGAYPVGNFNANWGTVTGTGHCFAFLICATFDACYSTGTGGTPGGTTGQIWIQTSHWAMGGFEVHDTSVSNTDSCFHASPNGPYNITDIMFFNDVANGCSLAGFSSSPYYVGGQYGVDYFILIGDIAYNGATSNAQCGSGASIWQPVNYDTAQGTHQYIAQYFAWGNVDPSTGCAGTAPTDGEGIILDTFTGAQSGFPTVYTGQTVIEDSIALFNGTNGFEIFASTAPVYLYHNTAWANGIGAGLSSYCGEFNDFTPATAPLISNTQLISNLGKTNSATACGGWPYAVFMYGYITPQNVIADNFGYSASSTNTYCWGSCAGFSAGPNNIFNIDPAFAAAPSSTPAAPSCSGKANVIDCMSTMIAKMTPTAASAAGYGYQPVNLSDNFNALYPSFLCNYQTQLAGLATQGCVAGGALE